MADSSSSRDGIGIGQALRDLPLEAPMQSLWPILAPHLPPVQKRTGHRYLPFALAAGLALFAIIPMSLNSPVLVENADEVALHSAMQQSSRLENILVATRNSTTGNASALVISLALEDRIRGIDVQLASGTLNASQQLGLWQQRVSILQEATSLYSAQRLQQAEGRPYEIALVESY